jgi:hypothetical protein
MIKATASSVTRIAAAIGVAFALTGAAQAQTVGTTFPAGFVVPADQSLGLPLIGFGAAGPVTKTPVIFVHDNGATPYPTGCGTSGANLQMMAQYFITNGGYAPSELWALGYQGTQCDLVNSPTNVAGLAHTHAANVPDLRAFVLNVLSFTKAPAVDIVAHGMGVTLVREWARQDDLRRNPIVRRFVAIDGPNQGTAMCSPDAANYWQMGFSGGYGPNSPLCSEIGSPNTPFMQTLNQPPPAIDAKATLVIRNGDSSYPFMPWDDGMVRGVPAVDVYGQAVDFRGSARIKRASEVTLSGQHGWDTRMGTAHDGIANSPDTAAAALSFLRKR